jgi:alanyl-tRNA synthetase
MATLRRQVNELRRAGASGATEQLVSRRQVVDGVPLVVAPTEAGDIDSLKSLVDAISQRLRSGVVVLAGSTDGRAMFVAKVSTDLIERGIHAGNLLREIAQRADGRGGGQAAFAQAGGSAAKLEEALAAAPDLLRSQLGRR